MSSTESDFRFPVFFFVSSGLARFSLLCFVFLFPLFIAFHPSSSACSPDLPGLSLALLDLIGFCSQLLTGIPFSC